MHILPISLQLYAAAMNHRCRKLGSKEYEFMRILAGAEREDHPHTQMSSLASDYKRQIFENKEIYYDGAACDSMWAKAATRKLWIKNFIEMKTFAKAKEQFDFWRRMQATESSRTRKFAQPAYQVEFGEHTLKLYHGLDTPQQTMLLGMRTGNIAVKSNPVFRYHLKTTDMSCPHCRYIPHTIKHMLCACPALNRVRTHLTGAADHNNFDTFMNRDTGLATSWAIAYMGIPHFDSVKNKEKYQFPRKQKVRCEGT